MSEDDPLQPPAEKGHHGHQHRHPPVSQRRHEPRHEDDDPIARYVEWTEHRYTPGYYLGGVIRPKRTNKKALHRP